MSYGYRLYYLLSHIFLFIIRQADDKNVGL